MLKFTLLLLVPLTLSAKTLKNVSGSYSYENATEYQAILAALKAHGEFSEKRKESEVTKTVTMSKGQQAVEEAKARNRAILAARNKADKEKSEEKLTTLEQWKKEERDTLNAWKKETNDLLNQWKKEQEIFLGRIKVYQKNTFELPVKTEKIVEKKVEVSRLPDVHIVNGAFKVPIRDQWNRPTCAAFSGTRVIEILLAQNNENYNLSEQYFYWASKPKCHTSPCSEKGSWVIPGYNFSKKSPVVDIPVESNCGYLGEVISGNDSQTPLKLGCKNGEVKVREFTEVRTLSDVIDSLKKDIPVILGTKLSPNFYKNTGLITLKDENVGPKMDGHSLGHAYVAVGVMELSEKLRPTEGNYCLVVANSWGQGWGAGGYSCVTEKWLLKYGQPASFVSVTEVATK